MAIDRGIYFYAGDGPIQPTMFFIANGVLSAVSDNVFVATVYINEVKDALDVGDITREHFDKLVIAINTGTNLPSVVTPNGQAAFLFLLTSALAPIIRLSYMRMFLLALTYTIVMSTVGVWAISVFIEKASLNPVCYEFETGDQTKMVGYVPGAVSPG